MSTLAVEGLRAERDATLTLAKGFTDAEWNASSDCAGWAVRALTFLVVLAPPTTAAISSVAVAASAAIHPVMARVRRSQVDRCL